jgi:hypothetical protein
MDTSETTVIAQNGVISLYLQTNIESAQRILQLASAGIRERRAARRAMRYAALSIHIVSRYT